jgi:hypothetical protein
MALSAGAGEDQKRKAVGLDSSVDKPIRRIVVHPHELAAPDLVFIRGHYLYDGRCICVTMSDFAEEIFNLLGNPNDSLRLSSMVDSFEMKDGSGDLQEVVVHVSKETPPSDVRWIKDTLSDYDMFYRFTVIQ